MKRPLIIFLAVVLAMAATSAIADPITAGDPDEGNSWGGGVNVYVPSGGPYNLIQARIHPGSIGAFESIVAPGWTKTVSDTMFLMTGPLTNNTITFSLYFKGNPPPSGQYVTVDWQQYGPVPSPNGTETLMVDSAPWNHANYELYFTYWNIGAKNGESSWTRNTPLSAADIVPEPFSMAFLATALVGVVGFRLRNRRKEGK